MKTSSNPVFGDGAVKKAKSEMSASGLMTVSGTMQKTFLLFFLFVASALISWKALASNADIAVPLMVGGGVVAFVVAIMIIFSKPSPVLTMLYSIAQGLTIGGISYYYADMWDGIVSQAVLLTVGITLGMYLAYATGFVKVTEKVKSIIIIGTLGVLFYYLITFVLSLFGVNMTSLFTGTTGVVIGTVIVIIAALNYLLDFDFIEKSAKAEAPKQFEWYGAFGLIVTLIWLYLSILQLLAVSKN